MNARQVCRELTERFYDKFGVYPVIRRRRYEGEYTLEKINLTNTIPFYKMGSTISMARWYIDHLKQVPHSTLTFETMEEVRQFKREQGEESKRKRNEQAN